MKNVLAVAEIDAYTALEGNNCRVKSAIGKQRVKQEMEVDPDNKVRNISKILPVVLRVSS